MKRSLLSIAICMWAGLLVLHGQFPSGFGVKAGISVADQSFQFTPIDYKLKTEAVTGPAFAIFMEAFRGAHFSFQLDMSYSLKGSKTSTESLTVDHLNNDRIIVNEGEQSKSTFKYLSVAPMSRYRLGQGSARVYFLLGPRFDILLKYETDSDYPLEDQNHLIPGLTFGSGFEYQLEKTDLFIELQYQGDIHPVTGRDPLLINNQMFSLTLGVRKHFSE